MAVDRPSHTLTDPRNWPGAGRNGRRLPPWLSKRVDASTRRSPRAVDDLLHELDLCTVCRSARCPNRLECYGMGRATFLLLGPACTRACRFCAVPHADAPPPPDPAEPGRVAQAVRRLGLRHAVVTSVTRDDLPDGGAAHFAATVAAIRAAHPCTIEVLTPDFQGRAASMDAVAEAGPDLFNHNLETVPRLYARVRPQADYRRSLGLFERLRDRHSVVATKSGLMLGLGEREDEVLALGRDLVDAGCRVLTVGQYLAPTTAHVPVAEFVHPDRFAELGRALRALGFAHVASGPFVRSSYHAEEVFEALRAPGAARASSD